MSKNQLVYTLQSARWSRVSGRKLPVMTPFEKKLLLALTPENKIVLEENYRETGKYLQNFLFI